MVPLRIRVLPCALAFALAAGGLPPVAFAEPAPSTGLPAAAGEASSSDGTLGEVTSTGGAGGSEEVPSGGLEPAPSTGGLGGPGSAGHDAGDSGADVDPDPADVDADAGDPDGGIEVAPDPVLPAGTYAIRPAMSDLRYLDIAGGSWSDGANLQIFRCVPAPSQRFEVSYADDGYAVIRNCGSGKVLDVAWGSVVPGANVQQFGWAGTGNQKWAIEDAGGGFYTVASASDPSVVLDVAWGADVDGANVGLFGSTSGANQRFAFEPVPPAVEPSGRTVPDGMYAVRSSLDPSLVLDVPGGSLGDGAALGLFAWGGTLNQRFEVALGSDGFYSVRPVHSGKALDVEASSIAACAGIVQWCYSEAADNQRWAIVDEGDGAYSLIAKVSGKALDIAWGDVRPGARLQTYYRTGSGNQRFVLTDESADPLAEGVFTLEPSGSAGVRFDVEGSSEADGARVLLWSATSGFNQKFQMERAEGSVYSFRSLRSGKYVAEVSGSIVQSAVLDDRSKWRASLGMGGVYLENLASGLRLDSSGGSLRPSAAAQSTAQLFSQYPAEPVDPGIYSVVSATGGRVLDAGGRADGAAVSLWASHGGGNQKWRLESAGGGWFLVRNCRTGKVFDASGKSSPGRVVQWTENGGSHQLWRAVPSGDGWFYLQSAAGLYLDVAWGADFDGAAVQTWPLQRGAASQRFRLNPTTYTPPPMGPMKRSDGSWDWCNNDGDIDRNEAIDKVISTARSLLGVPYVWLGVYPQDGGMDCASFTWYVYRQLGIDIGFETYDQMYAGKRVGSLSEAKPGDIILMYYGGWPNYNILLPEHVVLYAGNGMIYEEPDFGGHCQYVSLASKGAGRMEVRRIIGD